jgi:hypothetical protein
MPQYRGTPGPKSGSGWEGMGDFWDSIGNVNEEKNLVKIFFKKYHVPLTYLVSQSTGA